MTGNHRLSRNTVLGTVLLYAMFAALWIVLSDQALEWLFSDPAQITLASTVKGLLFVLVTSLLLYGLLRHRAGAGPIMPTAATPDSPWHATLPFVLLAAAILALTAAGISHSFHQQRDTELARLQAIADLRARQIVDWVSERRGEAAYIPNDPIWRETYRRWRGAGDTASRARLLERIDEFREQDDFEDVLILGAEGQPVWSSRGEAPTLVPALRAAVGLSLGDRAIRLLGPYRDAAGQLRMDIVSPLPRVAGQAGEVLVFRNDPESYLFPTLKTWPAPSASGETLLFRRDGDQVLFLNELRHQKDTTLRLRLPIAKSKLLSAQALRGKAGTDRLLEGVDYRGVAAVGVVQAIPGTDWLILAKLDRVELYGEATRDAVWIGLAGLLALFMAAAGYYLLRQRQQLALAAGTQQSQAERLRALRLLAAIADSSDDAIFAKDLEGRYILFNRAACNTVGKPAEAVLGRDDRDLFPADQAEMLMAVGRQVIDENRILTQEEVLDTPAGERVFLGTKGPLRDVEGKVIGTFGISRDITERKQAEAALQASETTYRSLFENMMNGYAYCRMIYQDGEPRDFIYLAVNQAFTTQTGLRDVVGRKVSEVIPGIRESDPGLFEIYGRVALSGEPERFEIHLEALRMWFSISVYSPRREYFVAVFDVITERKQAELELLESEARFRTLFDTAAVAIMVHDQDSGAVVEANRRAIEAYGYATLEALQQNDFWLEPPYSLAEAIDLIHKAVREGPQRFEWKSRDRQGRVFWEDVLLNRVNLNGVERVLSITTDITARKAAEAALYQQAEELRNRNEELERFNRATVGRELDMVALKQQINALSVRLGQAPPYPLAFLDDPSAQPNRGEHP